MRRPIRSRQRDLFAAPTTAPLPLPFGTRSEFVNLLSALLLEVTSHQRSQAHRAQQEPRDEQQNHA